MADQVNLASWHVDLSILCRFGSRNTVLVLLLLANTAWNQTTAARACLPTSHSPSATQLHCPLPAPANTTTHHHQPTNHGYVLPGGYGGGGAKDLQWEGRMLKPCGEWVPHGAARQFQLGTSGQQAGITGPSSRTLEVEACSPASSPAARCR